MFCLTQPIGGLLVSSTISWRIGFSLIYTSTTYQIAGISNQRCIFAALLHFCLTPSNASSSEAQSPINADRQSSLTPLTHPATNIDVFPFVRCDTVLYGLRSVCLSPTRATSTNGYVSFSFLCRNQFWCRRHSNSSAAPATTVNCRNFSSFSRIYWFRKFAMLMAIMGDTGS